MVLLLLSLSCSVYCASGLFFPISMSALSAKWQPACLSVSTDRPLCHEVCPLCLMICCLSHTSELVSLIHEAIVENGTDSISDS